MPTNQMDNFGKKEKNNVLSFANFKQIYTLNFNFLFIWLKYDIRFTCSGLLKWRRYRNICFKIGLFSMLIHMQHFLCILLFLN